jgi:hypothetical protein
VDWSKLQQILDARPVKGKARKGKFEFLLRWHNATPGEDTWVFEDHIPACFREYLKIFLSQWTKSQDTKKRGHNR